ncbi:class I SAM-dependent methyltransferase [bacterium]|nr:class I SAM-dependent methyltransferase [bacterium]
MAEHVCPWWLGYFLASPVRKLFQNPIRIVSPYITEGMTVMDVGSAMGFFSIPMGRLVGLSGKVICVDLQERMIASLRKRIEKAGLTDRMETRTCSQHSLNIEDLGQSIDFALTFALVHEVPDKKGLFTQILHTLKRNGRLLVAEPSGHVSQKEFGATIGLAKAAGFSVGEDLNIAKSHACLLIKG